MRGEKRNYDFFLHCLMLYCFDVAKERNFQEGFCFVSVLKSGENILFFYNAVKNKSPMRSECRGVVRMTPVRMDGFQIGLSRFDVVMVFIHSMNLQRVCFTIGGVKKYGKRKGN